MFHEGRASVLMDEKVGFMDETGALVIPWTPYEYTSDYLDVTSYCQSIMPFFSEGLAAMWGGEEQDGKYGYIDKEGKVAIPFAYYFAAPFSEGGHTSAKVRRYRRTKLMRMGNLAISTRRGK